jgi:hypothetical protein
MLDLAHDYLSPAQAGVVLGVSATRVTQLCNSGKLKCVRTPLGRLISRAVVLDCAAGRGIRVADVDQCRGVRVSDAR